MSAVAALLATEGASHLGTREPIVKQAESERRGPQAALANGGAVSLQLGPSEVPPNSPIYSPPAHPEEDLGLRLAVTNM